jgi:hypothetical protein
MENASAVTRNGEESIKRRVPVLVRRERVREAKASTFIAYDLETTRVAKGTPRPLYLTAYSEDIPFSFRAPIHSLEHLRALLITNFLTERFKGARFVAWNANHFDAYFIAAALILEPGYVIRPFLTRSKNLRGMLVIAQGDEELPPKAQRAWYFLDGMAMTGLQGVSLEKFLRTFAPDHQKLSDAIDFEYEEFDPADPRHVEYAMRDSEGLYYAIRRAEEILLHHFNEPLGVTMGRACIRIFASNIPEGVQIIQPSEDILHVLRTFVMRGGYCFCVRKYEGPIWKYDLNQAYASAMRSAKLPCGKSYRVQGRSRFAKVYVARVRARNPKNSIPFYYKTSDSNGRVRARFDVTEIAETWLTSIEIEQLLLEGWRIDWFETIVFDSSFSMKDYVDRLEYLRGHCEGGPSGAIGTMIKAVGNHSYGKTVEQLDPLELLIAKDCPEGFAEYFPDEFEGASEFYFPHVWYRKKTDSIECDYHQPQVGAFITAHVRMVVRRAALVNPEAWLYADTDCVVFSQDVTSALDIDGKRYGAWKIEANGEPYRILGKKIYASLATRLNEKTKRIVPAVAHAKGLNVNRLNAEDFARWYAGDLPEQEQVQRQNFVKAMRGGDMFEIRKRKGTRV